MHYIHTFICSYIYSLTCIHPNKNMFKFQKYSWLKVSINIFFYGFLCRRTTKVSSSPFSFVGNKKYKKKIRKKDRVAKFTIDLFRNNI